MKLLSLNTWGATQGQAFFDYIKQQSADTDIFCFQEIFSAAPAAPKISSGGDMYLFQELQDLLPDFKGFFAEKSKGYDFDGKVEFPVEHGLAAFVRKTINLASIEKLEVAPSLNEKDPIEGMVILQLISLGNKLSVLNYHGPALPGTKIDTEQRIFISNKIKNIWKNLPNQNRILCGDFNLYPETDSVKILDSVSNNLIKKFKIENTRNQVSWNFYPDSKQYFADYTFVSPEIKVKSFEVPYNEVSDHLPMLLDFDL